MSVSSWFIGVSNLNHGINLPHRKWTVAKYSDADEYRILAIPSLDYICYRQNPMEHKSALVLLTQKGPQFYVYSLGE